MPDSGRIHEQSDVDELRAALRDAGEYEGVPLAAEDSWERYARILQVLQPSRGLIVRTVLVGIALSLMIAFLVPKRYDATARLMPPDNQANSMLTMLMGSMADRIPGAALGASLLGGKTTGALFVGVLGSRTVQDKLVNQFELQRVYGDRYEEDARKDLEEHTTINEDKKSGIVTITVRDKDPERASKMAKAYVDELNALMSLVSTSSAHRERIFIEERLKDVTTDLNAAAQKFSRFASKNGALDIKEQTVAMVGAAADLQGQLIAAQSELQGVEQVYGPENVRVRALKAKVANLQGELRKMAGSSDPNSIAKEDELYPSIRKLPLLGVEWANLYRDTKIQEKVLELLTQQFEMSKIQEVKETPTVKTLDEPVTPRKKAWPPRGLIFIAGFLVSLLGSIGWILFRNRWAGTSDSAPAKRLARTAIEFVRPGRLADSRHRARG